MANRTFSTRANWSFEENDITLALRTAHSAGRDVIDLTRSNPTACGFHYGSGLLSPLISGGSTFYDPKSLGLDTARLAVAGYYADHGAEIATDHICLTSSTSEAYSFLFRLLCDPGDEVLVARPSYPLFEYLASLDDVVLREYPLQYDPNADAKHGWSIDLQALEAAITPRCRAILLVHPNNPTGSFASAVESVSLESICERHGLAIIVDEVFLDYAFDEVRTRSFAALKPACLSFVLSGISKVCALPQMKVSWIVVGGPTEQVREAVARLELIADTFLSVNTPGQLALPVWLRERRFIQAQILHRMRTNLASLDSRVAGTNTQRLHVQAGWTAILRVPRTVGDQPYAMAAVERGVLVQPGEFYGLPEGRVVLSLLTPADEWMRGLALLPVDD